MQHPLKGYLLIIQTVVSTPAAFVLQLFHGHESKNIHAVIQCYDDDTLKENHLECTVFTVSQRLSADSAHYAEKAALAGVSIRPFEPECLAGYNILVDCLLGTGFQGPLRENYRVAIEAINASKAYVVSVDINSGMNGDTGDGELAVPE